jgi:hypothetical protein
MKPISVTFRQKTHPNNKYTPFFKKKLDFVTNSPLSLYHQTAKKTPHQQFRPDYPPTFFQSLAAKHHTHFDFYPPLSFIHHRHSLQSQKIK